VRKSPQVGPVKMVCSAKSISFPLK
jgi:hypothetical protein